VIGPKDLPRVLRTVTLGIRKVRAMARDFQDGIEELAREADLQELRKEIEHGVGDDLQKEIESIGDPARDVEKSVREITDAVNAPETPAVSTDTAERTVGSAQDVTDDKKTGGAT